jgi:hypothetical protein
MCYPLGRGGDPRPLVSVCLRQDCSSRTASISSVTRTASGTMKPPAARGTYPHFSTSKSLRCICVVAVRPSLVLPQTSVIAPCGVRTSVTGRVVPCSVRSPSSS